MKASIMRRRLTAGTLVLGATLVALGITGSTAQADHVTGVPFEGNVDCADLGFDYEFKFQVGGVPDGDTDYTMESSGAEFKASDDSEAPAGLAVDISNVEVDDVAKTITFDWAASTDEGPLLIDTLLVKVGSGGLRYDYEPGVSEDTDVVSPKDSISHLSFCWGEPEETTTTEAPTTTEQAVSPTTLDSDVEGDVIAKDEVAPAQLPRTGDNDRALFLIGMGFITIGAVSMIARRQLYVRS